MTAVDLLTLPHGNGDQSWVYIHYAADNTVLYIGCTLDLRGRNRQHHRSGWWAAVADIAWTGPFDDRQEALDYEAQLIREHQPPHNVMYTDRAVHVYHPRKPLTPIQQAQEDVRLARLALGPRGAGSVSRPPSSSAHRVTSDLLPAGRNPTSTPVAGGGAGRAPFHPSRATPEERTQR